MKTSHYANWRRVLVFPYSAMMQVYSSPQSEKWWPRGHLMCNVLILKVNFRFYF